MAREGDRVRETEPFVVAELAETADRTSRRPTRPSVRPPTARSGPVPGIPDDERGDVFDAGCSTAEAGTGFGLRVVERVADANGWNVRVTDGTTSGARVDVSGVEFLAG